MSGRSELRDWWMEMAALTRRGTRLLLSQIGGSRNENGEFLDVVVGRVLAWCFCCFLERGCLLPTVGAELVGWKVSGENRGFSWMLGRMRRTPGRGNHRRPARRLEDQGWLDTMSLDLQLIFQWWDLLCCNLLSGCEYRGVGQLDSSLWNLKVWGVFCTWRGTLTSTCALFVV